MGFHTRRCNVWFSKKRVTRQMKRPRLYPEKLEIPKLTNPRASLSAPKVIILQKIALGFDYALCNILTGRHVCSIHREAFELNHLNMWRNALGG